VSSHLRELFTYLDSLPGRPDSLERFAAEVARFDIGLDDVSRWVRFSEKNYARNLMRTGLHYAAWVLCWKNGQRSPIHDHAGSCCVVRVLQGTATETLFEFAPNGHVKASLSRDHLEGSILASEDTDLHQVSNLQAGDANLITLHIYAPPLAVMGTYSLYDTTRGQEVWDPVFSEAAGI
jgi:cysteine dioxygenase